MVSTLAHDDGNIQVAVATVTPSQAVRVTPGRRVTVHSGSDSEVGHWQPRREIGTLIGKVDKVEAQLTKLKSTVEQQNKLIGEFIRSSLVLRNAKHPILLHQLILLVSLPLKRRCTRTCSEGK